MSSVAMAYDEYFVQQAVPAVAAMRICSVAAIMRWPFGGAHGLNAAFVADSGREKGAQRGAPT